MARPLKDLTSFRRDVLYCVAAAGPATGQTVKENLENGYGTELNDGRVYPALNDLSDADLIEKSQVNKRANSYRATDRALRRLEDDLEWRVRQFEQSAEN